MSNSKEEFKRFYATNADDYTNTCGEAFIRDCLRKR